MRRSRALFLVALCALIATSLFAAQASASGQCTKPPSGGSDDEKKSGCSAATASDGDVEIVKLSAKDFEKTIAGEDEEGVTLILFDDGKDR